jgi:hypothetical protein
MARPVKWSRDLHSIRERAAHARTETWGRLDIEQLFGVGRATAQTLMKAIGEVQPVGGAHFVERSSLLSFLDAMIDAPDFDLALRSRVREADAPPSPKPLRVALPSDLRSIMLRDLPENISLSPGRLEITADSAVVMLESLALLAQAMQNDLAQVQAIWEPAAEPPEVEDDDLRAFLSELRRQHHG